MIDRDSVRRYFSEAAPRWLAAAYGGAGGAGYPLGAERARLALAAVLERIPSAGARLVDLGCGGGELCLAAAATGFEVTGVDSAEGMLAAAEARRRDLAPAVGARLRFHEADVLATALTGESFDAATALGLLEYLDEDGPFLREAARLLRAGGVLVVSCRNRLFNLASLNDVTRGELVHGAGPELLAELDARSAPREFREALRDFVVRLRAALPDLERALGRDEGGGEPAEAGEVCPPRFAHPRRQHTPRQLAAAAAAAGFEAPRFLGAHPHPFPPALEPVAPHFYNRLARVFEAFETLPESLAWSSSFLGVFTRCR